jgi:NADH:ubiquinone oxidoreductase subunit 6 (subunit J)
MHFPDRYRYPLFFLGLLLMIASAFLYKFNILTLEVEEILIVIGAVLFVFSIASALIK